MSPQTKLPLTRLGKCPLCKSANRKKNYVIQDSEVFQCAECSLRYLDPCLSPEGMRAAYESEESLQDFHDFHEGYYEYGDLNKKSKTLDDFNQGLELLEKNLSGEKKILDIGFGNGFFLAAAQKRGWKVQGIDSSQTNVQKAKEKYGLNLQKANLETDIPDEDYDAITFWDVIEHLPNPHEALQKVKTFLKPNGKLLIAVPSDDGFLSHLSAFLYTLSGGHLKTGVEKFYVLEHVSYYTPKSLELLGQTNGFKKCDSFSSSTDLAKYNLAPLENLMAQAVLSIGKLTNHQNRIIMVFSA